MYSEFSDIIRVFCLSDLLRFSCTIRYIGLTRESFVCLIYLDLRVQYVTSLIRESSICLIYWDLHV